MKKTLGIIGAEQQEIDLLLEHLSLEKTVKKAGLSFFCGTIHEYPVVIVKAGIGKVNAAACTQMLIDLFDVKMIVNTGAAGSLDSRINIGDIVVSTEVIQHDLDVTDLGYKPGDVPGTGKIFTSDKLLHDLAGRISKQQMNIVRMKGCGYGVREIAKSEKLPVRCIKDLLEEAHVVFLELCRE